MNEPSGVPSALGIEAVEWSARGEDSLTVRVTGRWRRRRPDLSGQPLLVIEAGGQRHRFPAMPEPPGLTGAAPGTWQLSFTVPGVLGPPALERAWLQMGAAVVPLPVAMPAEAGESLDPDADAGPALARPEDVLDPQLLAERRLRSSELALQATRQRATQAEQRVADLAARVEELRRELEALRAEPVRLQALLLQRDAARRAAEQRAHAEQAMRTELQEELAQLEGRGADSDAVLEELDLARGRVSELESELEQLSRQVDEAEQIAAAAQVARGQAQAALEEWAAAQSRSAVEIPGLAWRVETEQRLWTEIAGAAARPVQFQPVRRPNHRALAAERRLIDARGHVGASARSVDEATLDALRRELAARAAGEARLRSQIAAVAQEPSVVSPASTSLTETLVALRAELSELRALTATERQRRLQAESRAGELEGQVGEMETQIGELERQIGDYAARSALAYEAIEGLRGELDRMRPALAAAAPDVARRNPDPGAVPDPGPGAGPDPGPSRGSLDPARLEAALARLRETAAAREAAAAQEAAAARQAAAAAQAARPSATPEADPPAPWLDRAFGSLAARDPAAAARLLVALLTVQGKVRPEQLGYDLVLDGIGCLQVTVAGPDHRTSIRLAETPRPATEVRFALSGAPASVAALVASGSLRRRFGRRRVRITGDRQAAGALLALVRVPIKLRDLNAAGLRIDRWLSLTLASLMVDLAWTRGEQFSLAFQEPGSAAAEVFLHVRDGRSLVVSVSALTDAPAATVVCGGDQVLAVLDGDLPAGAQLRGDRRPLALLQHWIERAQSG